MTRLLGTRSSGSLAKSPRDCSQNILQTFTPNTLQLVAVEVR